MIVFEKGKIFVDGVETIDAELIGFAVKDFVEDHEGAVIALRASYGKMPILFEKQDGKSFAIGYEGGDFDDDLDLVTTNDYIKELNVDAKICSGKCNGSCGSCE